MKRRTALTTVGVGVLSLGLFAGTAVAAGSPPTGPDLSDRPATCDGTGTGAGAANGRHTGRGPGPSTGPRGDRSLGNHPAGAGDRDGTAYPSGVLTDDQAADLNYLVQEEKLALDLYTAFGAEYDVRIFTRIAGAESRHLDAVRTLLETYGIADPTVGLDPGEFVDPDLTVRYDTLLAQGMTSLDDALAAGRAVELDDIAELGTAAAGVTAEDVARVYARLLAGSEKHLAAFEAA